MEKGARGGEKIDFCRVGEGEGRGATLFFYIYNTLKNVTIGS